MTIGEWIDYHREDAAKEAREEVWKEARNEQEKAVRERQLNDIWELLEDYGEVPPELMTRMEMETDAVVLKRWHKLAAKSSNMEEFIKRMDE